MAFRGLLIASLALMVAVSHATDVSEDKEKSIIAADGSGIVLNTDMLVYLSILVLGGLALIALIGLYIPKEEPYPTGYAGPTSYAAHPQPYAAHPQPFAAHPQPHAHHQSSYTSIHRTLEDAADKYE